MILQGLKVRLTTALMIAKNSITHTLNGSLVDSGLLNVGAKLRMEQKGFGEEG
jgi:hypothetical protein